MFLLEELLKIWFKLSWFFDTDNLHAWIWDGRRKQKAANIAKQVRSHQGQSWVSDPEWKKWTHVF